MRKSIPKRPNMLPTVEQVSDDILRQFLGYHVKRAYNVIRSDLQQALEPFGLRLITYSTLALIVENPGVRQSQLADALAIERPNLVVIIDELEQRDLITRERIPTDRRAYALKATLAGRRLCEKAVEADLHHEAALLSGLSATERDLLARALIKIERGRSG